MKYPVSPEENYNLICKELKAIVSEMENNPNMPEADYEILVERFRKLSEALEQYGKMKYS